MRVRGRNGNEGDRRDGANVEAAKIVFAAHVETAEGRNFLAGVPGGMRDGVVQAEDIALLEDGAELGVGENVGDGVDVAAQRAAGNGEGVEVAFAGARIDGIVDRVVGDAKA